MVSTPLWTARLDAPPPWQSVPSSRHLKGGGDGTALHIDRDSTTVASARDD